MAKRTLAGFNLFVCAVLILSFALLSWSLLADNARLAGNSRLTPVAINGEYRVDDGAWQPLPYQANALSANGTSTVSLRGRLTQAVPAGETLLLRIENLRVEMRVDGRDVFSFGRQDTYPAFAKSAGNVWQSFVSPGIGPESTVEITLQSVYPVGAADAFSDFLNRMYMGSERLLLSHMLAEHAFEFIVGALIIGAGFLLLLTALVGMLFRISFVRAMYAFAGLTITSGVWYFCVSDYLSLLLPYPVFCNIVSQLALYAVPMFAALYLLTRVKGPHRAALMVNIWLDAAFLLLAVVQQALGLFDCAQLQPVGACVCLLTAGCIVVCLLVDLRTNPDARYTLLSFLPLAAGGLVDTANYLFGFSPLFIAAGVGFLAFVVIQMCLLLSALQQSAKRAQQLENDLLQNRITMMLSQIQPHFLYNSLTAIKQLCSTDPARAEAYIGDFASYLRLNLDSLSRQALIPFSRELMHTQYYLELEEMRFGSRLKVCYDTRYQGFSLPSLTIQPLVENAVRYGVTKKPEGGTVTIFSDETEDAYIVRISDDGVGFDPAAPLPGERSHTGIENVKSRLAALCDGTLTLESEVGCGTTVTIQIPKREASECI